MSNKNFKIKNGLDVEREITATDISLSDSYPTISPSLNLDFAKTQNLDPRISFSRNSIATYIANDGLIKIANADQPRFEFDANTKQCKGLLIEEARTNLLTYSENFDNAAWGKVRTTIAANITTAPDGLLTADMVIEDTTATNTHRLDSSAITVTNGVTYTFSIYVKAGSRYSFDLYIEDVGISGAYFNLNTGTISAPQSAGFTNVSSTALITSIGNGWYRCSVIRVSAGTSSFPALRISNGTSTTYTGDGISGIYVWGAQIEAGSFPTSYIPSTDTFTSRGSTATYIGSDGLIKTAAINTARYQYNPLNLALAPKLLLESAANNLITYSEDFSNAVWSKVNTSITINSTTAPDGTVTADKLVETGTFYHSLERNTTVLNANTYCQSVFLKAGERTQCHVLFYEGSAYYGYKIDLSTGIVSVNSIGGVNNYSNNAIVSSVGNGWYRCAISRTMTGTTQSFQLRLHNSADVYTGDGTSGIYIWGAQLEAGSFPTSYIPTTTSTVVRSADVSSSATTARVADLASMTGTNFSSWYNQTEGSILCSWKQKDISSTNDSAFSLFRINGGGADAISARIGYSSFRRLRPFGYASSTFQYVIDSQYTAGESGIFALGYKKDISDFALAENGNPTQLDTTGSLSTMAYMNNILIGNDGTNRLNGHISKLTYYPRRLSNSQLQNLTK